MIGGNAETKLGSRRCLDRAKVVSQNIELVPGVGCPGARFKNQDWAVPRTGFLCFLNLSALFLGQGFCGFGLVCFLDKDVCFIEKSLIRGLNCWFVGLDLLTSGLCFAGLFCGFVGFVMMACWLCFAGLSALCCTFLSCVFLINWFCAACFLALLWSFDGRQPDFDVVVETNVF